MMTVGDVLSWAKQKLIKSGIQDPLTDCEILLEKELGVDRARLYAGIKQEFSVTHLESFKKKVFKRAKRFPLAYILGDTNFMGFDIAVNKDVLIPRQETELLAEKAIDVLSGIKKKEKIIVDVGTGSGNIAVSIARAVHGAKIYAIDISEKALVLAAKNARRNKVTKKITFLRGDIFGPMRPLRLNNKIDLIVSNPPYIPEKDINGLQKEVHFEPRIALDGGKDGLDFYKIIITQAPFYLKRGGCLLFEMGIKQSVKIKNLINSSGKFEKPMIIKDYSSIDRIVCVFLKK